MMSLLGERKLLKMMFSPQKVLGGLLVLGTKDLRFVQWSLLF